MEASDLAHAEGGLALAVRIVTIWGFPKIRGTFLGVPLIRIIVFWGLYWGPLILGNYHIICNSNSSSDVHDSDNDRNKNGIGTSDLLRMKRLNMSASSFLWSLSTDLSRMEDRMEKPMYNEMDTGLK